LAGETEVLGENLPSAALSTTNPTCCPDVNQGHGGGKPASNRLSYGTAQTSTILHGITSKKILFFTWYLLLFEDFLLKFYQLHPHMVTWNCVLPRLVIVGGCLYVLLHAFYQRVLCYFACYLTLIFTISDTNLIRVQNRQSKIASALISNIRAI
jgi:hypothetical protein